MKRKNLIENWNELTSSMWVRDAIWIDTLIRVVFLQSTYVLKYNKQQSKQKVLNWMGASKSLVYLRESINYYFKQIHRSGFFIRFSQN